MSIIIIMLKFQNVDNSFNIKFTRKRFFCISENISWVRDYLTYLEYLGIFCKLETKIQINLISIFKH